MRHQRALIAIFLIPFAAQGSEPLPRSQSARYHREIQGLPQEPMVVLDAGGHTGKVRRVLFTPDGSRLITVSEDKTARIWDTASGESLRVLRPPIGMGPEGMLYAAAISPDGQTLAVGGYGKLGGSRVPIHLFSLASGRIEQTLLEHTGEILSLAFSRDGNFLASSSGDATAGVWDLRGEGRPKMRVLRGHTQEVFGVAFSPDGSRLATVSADKTGRVWSAATGQVLAVLQGHRDIVHCLAWRPDGQVIATGGFDQTVRYWAPDGRSYAGLSGLGAKITSLAYSADSRRMLITRGFESNVCSLVDTTTGHEIQQFRGHDDTVMHGTFAPQGTIVATAGGHNQQIYLWRTDDASVIHDLVGKGTSLWGGGWSPDGTVIGWGTDWKGGDILSATLPLDRSFSLVDLAFSTPPDGSFVRARLSQGERSLKLTTPSTAKVLRDGAQIAEVESSTDTELIRCMTLLPDGRMAMGASYGLYLFPDYGGKPKDKERKPGELSGHSGAIWSLSPSPDARYLLSSSDDQTLRIWDLRRVPDHADEEQAALVLSLFFAGENWVAWTPEGYYAASAGGENLMGWHLNQGPDAAANFYPASQFRKKFFRPDVIKLLRTAGSTARAVELADEAKGRAATKAVVVAKVLPPEVEIASPRTGAALESQKLEVKAIAKGRGPQPVTSLRLFLDGRPYRGQAGLKTIDPPRTGVVKESWEIELEPGPHKIAVQASSEASQSLSEAVEVMVATTERESVELPNLYVLAVGVSAYPGDLRLNYAAKDAEAIERSFRQASNPLFRKIEARLLTDDQATRTEISRGLSWLKQQMTQKDIGIVFFSGHGQKDNEGSLYFLPVDVDTDDLLTTAVPDAVIKKALAGMPGRIIALLDACHAGAIGGDRRKGGGTLTDELVRDLVTDDYGVVVMASSMGREFSLENNAKRQGSFTVALTEGLEGKADTNKDGVVYLNELDAYITDRVKELTKGQQHPVTAKPTSIRSFPLAKP